MDVEIGRRAEALNERDRASVGLGTTFRWIVRLTLTLAIAGAMAPAIARIATSGAGSERLVAQICSATGWRYAEISGESSGAGGAHSALACVLCARHSGDATANPALDPLKVALVQRPIALALDAIAAPPAPPRLLPLSLGPPDSN